jgi:hypothetical protein
MTNFTFNDRDTYKSFVRNWKTVYAETSILIRQTKAEMKTAAKAGNHDRAGSLQAQREYLRRDQRNALRDRQSAKEEAQRQYLAAREAEAKQAA